jgi:hypothetical protein
MIAGARSRQARRLSREVQHAMPVFIAGRALQWFGGWDVARSARIAGDHRDDGVAQPRAIGPAVWLR